MAGIFTRDQPDDDIGRATARPYDFIRPITASAAKIDLSNKTDVEQIKKRKTTSDWQSEAWEYVDEIGEVKYAFNLVGNVTSRCRIYPAAIKDLAATPSVLDKDDPDLPDGLYDAAVVAMRRLESTTGGQAALLREAAFNLSVSGEALDVDTPVATPSGLRRIGDLNDGDVIYGGDGQPCRVIRAHPVREGRPCYELTFTGGVTVVADAEHLWQTHTRRDRMYSRQFGREYEPSVLTTEEISRSLYHVTKGGSEHINHAIPLTFIAGDSDLDNDLPVDPYLLGYWLGDGVTTQGALTAHPSDQDHLRVQIEKAGYGFSVRNCDPRGFQIGVTGGLVTDLRAAGVLGNKHIPGAYFRASSEARLALLQGLVDSDGHIAKNGAGEFSNTNKRLIWGFVELASSLGVRVGRPRRRPDGTTRVCFTPCGVRVARLPRKAERIKEVWERDRWRSIPNEGVSRQPYWPALPSSSCACPRHESRHHAGR